MSRMWRLAHSLMEEYVGAPVFGICCLKPKDPASLSSRIARHEEHYEQLQRRHHSILRAYFPSVVAGLPPSQRAVYPQLWYGVRRPRGDEMGWLSMDPSTPHERQPETQSMHALACFSSGTNSIRKANSLRHCGRRLPGVISLTFRDLGLYNMAPPWQSGPGPCPRQSFLLAFVRLAKGTPTLHPTVCGASRRKENYGAWPKLPSPSTLWDGPGLPGLSDADDISGVCVFRLGTSAGSKISFNQDHGTMAGLGMARIHMGAHVILRKGDNGSEVQGPGGIIAAGLGICSPGFRS
ncbi:hypothetical protein CSPX01_11634 [Colletotrichum filicis]|nr:hypothetical protein CSPX01_11634 [Colletotrichum filicis]